METPKTYKLLRHGGVTPNWPIILDLSEKATDETTQDEYIRDARVLVQTLPGATIDALNKILELIEQGKPYNGREATEYIKYGGSLPVSEA